MHRKRRERDSSWTPVLLAGAALTLLGCPSAPSASPMDGGPSTGLADSGPDGPADGGAIATDDGGPAPTDGGANGTDGGDDGDGGPPSLGVGFGRYLPSRDVRATLVQGTTLYLGGIFNRMQAHVGPFAAVSSDDGTLLGDIAPAPPLTGTVTDAAPLEDGGLVIVGNFVVTSAPALAGIAKLLPDGRVDPLWSPADGGGMAVAAHDGTAYVARVGLSPSAQALVRAVDLESGEVTSWGAQFAKDGPPNAYINIRKMKVVGEKLYVAGDFSEVNGEARPGVAAFDLAGHLDASFAPSVGQLDVYDIDVMGSSLLVAGSFVLDDGGVNERRGLLGLELDTGALTDWAPMPNAGAQVRALAVDGATAFIGGVFAQVNGEPRATVVLAVDEAGALADWTLPSGPSLPAGPVVGVATSLSVINGALYGGGGLTVYDVEQGTVRGNNAFAADISTGALLDWNPSPGDGVHFVAPLGDGVGIGGSFRVAGGEPRSGAAAIDLRTGALLEWDPLAGKTGSLAVYDIEPRGDALVLAGYLGDDDPVELVVADPLTGAVLDEIQIEDFQDESAGIFTRGTTAIALVGERICVAGNTLIPTTTPRPGKVVCLDSAGEIAFSVDMDNYVWALEPLGGELVVGGVFTSVGGVPAGPLVRLDASGERVDWAPSLGAMDFDTGYGGVSSLVTLDGVLYASGDLLVDDVEMAIVSVNPDASLGAFQVERGTFGTFKLGAAGAELLGASTGSVSVYSTTDAEPTSTWSITGVQVPYGVHKLGQLLVVGGSSFSGLHLNATVITSP